MPQAIVNVKNNYATTMITNIHDEPIRLNFIEAINIEPLNLAEVNFIKKKWKLMTIYH